MRIINTWRDPYGEGFSICRRKQIEIDSGLTILVGCNGAGKSTLLSNIKQELTKNEVPVLSYDNHKDNNRSNTISKAAFYENFNIVAAMSFSSEGECISIGLGTLMSKLKNFIKTGNQKHDYDLVDAFYNRPKPPKEPIKERWILVDAIDSGYSVDNIIELKDLFKEIIDDGKRNYGVDVYIIVSANEYEMASGENCFDVNACKYLKFKDYDDYKKFILHSRELKNKRIEIVEKKKNKKTKHKD